jgi:hypothetical protein
MPEQLHSVSHTKQLHCSGKAHQNRKLLTLGSNWYLYHVNAITETGIQKKKRTLLGQLEVSRGEGLFQEILDLVKPKGFEPSTHHPSLYIQTDHRRNIRQL